MALIIILNLKSSLRFQFKHLNQALKIILNLQICWHFHFKHLNGSWKFAFTKLHFYINYISTTITERLLRRSLTMILKRIFKVNWLILILTFFSFLISNILFKIMVNDFLNNLSMIVGTSLRSLEPCKKELIDHDLEENV